MNVLARRVLLADDDSSTRLIAHSVLETAGFSLMAVRNGAEAVRCVLERMPDILLLDLEMPEIDGYETCRQIRQLPGGAALPIVVVTGMDDPASIERAFAAGATDFVTKPINWVLLVHRVQFVLRGAAVLGALQASEEKNHALLRAMPDSIFLLNELGGVDGCVAGDGGLPGDEPRDDCPLSLVPLLPLAFIGEFTTQLGQVVTTGNAAVLKFNRVHQAVPQYLELRLLPHQNRQVLSILRDVSEQEFAEQRILRLAYFDILTDLPNREWMEEHLTTALLAAESSGTQLALLFIDLDQFRRVNDTLGQRAGDAVLLEVADRLRRVMLPLHASAAEELPLVRLGADEFLVWLPATTGMPAIAAIGESFREAFEPPFACSVVDLDVRVTASVGIALSGVHGSDLATLVRNVDAAAQHAKGAGRNRVVVYHTEMNSRVRGRLELETDLRFALAHGGLEVHYQPKYRVVDLALVGAEALLRWKHPKLGPISPAEFIGIAEETGFIVEIDRWVVNKVCEDVAAWRALGKRLLPVAVNLSAHEFLNPTVVQMLTTATERAAIPHGLIELEITENALVRDADLARTLLTQLRDAGFSLAIDDFGTGYSSLQYLRSFPVHTLKIDRSFVAGAPDERDACALIRAVIQIAHSLDLSVVAEGVETYRQLDLLKAEGCDYLQGYLMDPALPPAAYAAML
jgi:diguanylate cyclase (GGDEF)-like protein